MDILMRIVQLVACLSLLVIVHEFGHFIFAKIFKARVEKFYLFFNPWFSLFKFRKGETEYGVGWLPLGGYVSIAGMVDETQSAEQLASEPQPWEFRSKKPWQRLLILAGGVLMNVVLACLIYIGICFTWGERYVDNRDLTHGYVYSELAHEIGFEDGDRILALDGVPAEGNYAKLILSMFIDNQVKCVDVLRGGDTVKVYIREEFLPRVLNQSGGEEFMRPVWPFKVAELMDGGAREAGLAEGDCVVGVEGNALSDVVAVKDSIAAYPNQTIQLAVLRAESGVVDTLSVAVSAEGAIGVKLQPIEHFYPVTTYEYSFWEAIPAGFRMAGNQLVSYWNQLKLIVQPESEAYKSVGSFVAIGSIFPSEWNWFAFWQIAAMLSIVLAVMNILPIPGLDGGHIVFVLWEMITGRKPSEKVLGYAQMVGMILLIALMIFAFGNDIRRFIL